MLDLTRQERKVILFLSAMALIGLGVSFGGKLNSRVESFIGVSDDLMKIDLNRVSLEDLEHTKYLPRKLARKIIDFRNERGSYKNLTDLLEVKGIGERRYEKLKEMFFVD